MSDHLPESGPNRLSIHGIASDVLSSLCDQACSNVSAWHSVADELVRLVKLQISENDFQSMLTIQSNELGATAAAFQYSLRTQLGKSERIRDAFAPMAEFSDGSQVPPKIAELPPAVIDTWTDISRQLSHPGGLSRLNDLLFCRGLSEAGLHARAAIDGYLNLKETGWSDLEVTHALLRAVQLAKGTHDDQRTDRAIACVGQHYWAGLERSAPPGITIPLIEVLFDFDHMNAEADRMISAARELYREPHITDQLIHWQVKRSRDQAQRQQYLRERVRVWLDAAKHAEPLVKVMHLETAARYVDEANDPQLRQEVRSLLQAAGREDLGMKRITSELTLPQEEVERYLAQFVEPDDWQGALDGFSRHPPPTGNYEENLRLADQIDATAPLQAIIPRVRFGGDGLPRWRPTTEEDQQDSRLAQQEELHALVLGGLLAQGLHRIGDHYPRPNRDELVSYFSARSTLAPGTAEQLAAAIDLFWVGEESAAAYMAIWLIEPLLRTLLLQTDDGIYVVQRQGKPGQYPGLSFLLKALRTLGLDLSWYRYLWTVFASPAGLNLRNEIAHGFTSRIGATPAALAIHASCFLTTISVTRTDGNSNRTGNTDG